MHLKLMGLLLVALVTASIVATPATVLSIALPVSTTDNEDSPAELGSIYPWTQHLT